MDYANFDALYQFETTPEALEETSQYVAKHLKPFLSLLEPVLICFPDHGPASLGGLFKRAVELCGAIAIVWGPDYRWKELLRLAFDAHANTLIGPPQVLLGLMKLARVTRTPLYFYDVIACGDPFPRWMVNSLKQGLDCMVWGCYAIHSSAVIAGFSCTQEAGIHIRDDKFTTIVDREDNQFANNWGRLRFRYNDNPDVIFDPEQIALLHHQPCSCGCDAPRVQRTYSSKIDAATQENLLETVLSWSSILDFRAENTESGLKLEIVAFPNETLPELPSCAYLRVRTWEPQEDIPFFIQDNYPDKCEISF